MKLLLQNFIIKLKLFNGILPNNFWKFPTTFENDPNDESKIVEFVRVRKSFEKHAELSIQTNRKGPLHVGCWCLMDDQQIVLMDLNENALLVVIKQ